MLANKSLDSNQEEIRIANMNLSERKSFVEERIAEYVKMMKRSRRPPNTVGNFERLLTRVQRFHLEGDIKAYNLQASWFNDFIFFLSEKCLLVNSSVAVYLERIFAVFNYFNIVYSHDIPRFYLKRDPKHKIEDEILSENEVDRLWAYSPKEKYLKALRDKCIVSLYTGLRSGELETIFTSMDDDGNRLICYYGSKNKEAKTIVMHPRIEEIIDRELFKKKVSTKIHMAALLNGIHLQGEGVELIRQGGQNVRSMVSRKNIVTFHSMRKTFCIRMLEGGMDTYTLANYLGHSNINVTLKYYSYIRSKDLLKKTSDVFKNVK